jgi:hypothetical protein
MRTTSKMIFPALRPQMFRASTSVKIIVERSPATVRTKKGARLSAESHRPRGKLLSREEIEFEIAHLARRIGASSDTLPTFGFSEESGRPHSEHYYFAATTCITDFESAVQTRRNMHVDGEN